MLTVLPVRELLDIMFITILEQGKTPIKTDREKYAQVKRSLAMNKRRYVQHYADAKTLIGKEIMGRMTHILPHNRPITPLFK